MGKIVVSEIHHQTMVAIFCLTKFCGQIKRFQLTSNLIAETNIEILLVIVTGEQLPKKGAEITLKPFRDSWKPIWLTYGDEQYLVRTESDRYSYDFVPQKTRSAPRAAR